MPASERLSSERQGASLLIVEDDPSLQKQICWAFDQYEPVAAADRESALAQLRRHAPAVVTMDLGLPPDPDSVVGRLQAARADPRARAGHQGDRPHRTERSRQRRARDRTRRLRFLCQAVRAGTAGTDHRSRLPSVRSAAGEPAPAIDAPAGCVRRAHHARPRPAADLPDDRKGRGYRGDGPAAGRKRHRQGAARAGAARPVAAARRALRRDQLCRHSGNAAGERAVRLREGRVHRRREADDRQDRDSQPRHADAGRDRRPAPAAAGASCCASCRSA